MYLRPSFCGYDRDGSQFARRQLFLILIQCEGAPGQIRALVRKVALRQCGHWMMGSARVGSQSITVSGAYGSDGLPKTVPTSVWERGIPLPADLYDAWNKGGGHNSAGSEANAMRAWALANLKNLSPKK